MEGGIGSDSGKCVYNDGVEEGIRAFVIDGIEDQILRERSVAKLQRYFHLTKEKAEQYYDMFASEA